MTFYNTNVDLVNDNVYRSILFQDMEQKLNYAGMAEREREREREKQRDRITDRANPV